jgi:hypothetical protein
LGDLHSRVLRYWAGRACLACARICHDRHAWFMNSQWNCHVLLSRLDDKVCIVIYDSKSICMPVNGRAEDTTRCSSVNCEGSRRVDRRKP